MRQKRPRVSGELDIQDDASERDQNCILARFSVMDDDGVIISNWLEGTFEKAKCNSGQDLRGAVVQAGTKRFHPSLITISTPSLLWA